MRIETVHCDNCGKEQPETTPDMVRVEVPLRTFGCPIHSEGMDFCSLVCLYRWAEKATMVGRKREVC